MEDFHLHHVASGGTIDSHWDGSQDTAIPNAETIVHTYLTHVARLSNVTSETLFMLDSRKMGRDEQKAFVDRITETAYKRILGTVGTFLMADVARRTANHPMARLFEEIDRRIAFTGAIIPVSGYIDSDGGYNCGMSTAVLQLDAFKRVSLVMNGSVFDAKEAYKDLTTATFEGAEGTDQLPYADFDLVTVGGSIDFSLDGLDGLVPSPESHVPVFLRNNVRTLKSFHAINPFVKDSRDLQPRDIERVCKIIKGSRRRHILLTSGLYKIIELCEAINATLTAEDNKHVMLTGSRIPLSLTDKTDAPFNLGYAMGVLGSLPAGAHVALNGRTYETNDEVMRGIYTPAEQQLLRARGVIS